MGGPSHSTPSRPPRSSHVPQYCVAPKLTEKKPPEAPVNKELIANQQSPSPGGGSDPVSGSQPGDSTVQSEQKSVR